MKNVKWHWLGTATRLIPVAAACVGVAVGWQQAGTAPPPMFGDYTVIAPSVPEKRGAFKITENESPKPADRVYLNYNFYEDVRRDIGIGGENNHRYTLGLEKVLGNGSIGF